MFRKGKKKKTLTLKHKGGKKKEINVEGEEGEMSKFSSKLLFLLHFLLNLGRKQNITKWWTKVFCFPSDLFSTP